MFFLSCFCPVKGEKKNDLQKQMSFAVTTVAANKEEVCSLLINDCIMERSINFIGFSPVSEIKPKIIAASQLEDIQNKKEKQKKVEMESTFFASLDNPEEFRLKLQKLEDRYAYATYEERCRFLKARKEDYDGALAQLREYLSWRETFSLDSTPSLLEPVGSQPEENNDEDDFYSCTSREEYQDEWDWYMATKAALSYFKTTTTNTNQTTHLPQLARMVTRNSEENYAFDQDGSRILQLLPAQLDLQLASNEIYILCIAYYLDKKLSRKSLEKICVTIDVRAGHGWANPPASSVLPFIKKVISTLEANFPERLSRSIVFPLPAAATILWKVIKFFLDPDTATKVAVLSGGADKDAPLPMKNFCKYIEEDILHIMEENRKGSFC